MAETDNKLFTQKVSVQLLPSDSTLHNTICLPFKDIFKGTVRLVAIKYEETKLPIYNKAYKVRVVEALVGTWLARVTEYVLGNAGKAYDNSFVALVEPRIAKSLREHGIVGNSNTPNFPDIYKKGDVPPGYDPTEFNPDMVYPGQRFIFIEPVETITFSVPMDVKPPEGFFDNIWVGAVWGAQAEFGISGSHTTIAGGVFNVGKAIKSHFEPTGICLHGWSVGLGVGISSGATLLIFVNFPTLQSLNHIDAPDGTSKWWKDNWDWDLALSVKIPKSTLTIVKQLFIQINNLKGLGKLANLGTKGEIIRSLIENILKNIKGGFPEKGDSFAIQIAVPMTGPGLNIWIGWKTTEYITYPINVFGDPKK